VYSKTSIADTTSGSTLTNHVLLNGLEERIGQQYLQSPSVFNFYLPEFTPAGPIAEAGLVAPEAELGTAPNVVGWMNGIVSLVNYGLTSCTSGFGSNAGQSGSRSCNWQIASQSSDGHLTYAPQGDTGAAVVEELALLLTAGRLNSRAHQVIASHYDTTKAGSDASAALKKALKLLLISSEFHTTNANKLQAQLRQQGVPPASKGRRLKALVVLFMKGGADTFNLLVPHSNCQRNGAAADLYEEYKAYRGDVVALTKAQLTAINVPNGNQPCSTFGVHKMMPTLAEAYTAGDAAFFANVGAMVDPLTKAEWEAKPQVKETPPSLFAHNIMTRSAQNLHAQAASSKGVLGRIVETLNSQPDPFLSNTYSLTGNTKVLEGAQPPEILDKTSGVVRFTEYATLKGAITEVLTSNRSSSVFADTYAGLVNSALAKSETLGEQLDQVTLDPAVVWGSNSIDKQFKQVAKVIGAQGDTKTERAAFFVSQGSFDTHNNAHETFDGHMTAIDAALSSFKAEMIAKGTWSDVAILAVSEFGRTLTSNGLGTDHAWGGNYFLMGGGVKGEQILGEFPEDLREDSDVNIGRGRILPTRSWESIWYGLAQWLGVDTANMKDVLPNYDRFPMGNMFTKSHLFD